MDGLRKHLAPVRRETLVSAQLMKRKQTATETVDQYAQDFKTLFDRSYGRREGMDQESKDLLKRDLFVLGLRMKWQENVLPSAESFSDSLHQVRAAEEQERQLNELHQPKGSEAARSSMAAEGSAQRRFDSTLQVRLPEHPSPPVRSSRCWKCGAHVTNRGIVHRDSHRLRLHGEELELVPMQQSWLQGLLGWQRVWRNGVTGSGMSGLRRSSCDSPSHISQVLRWTLSLDLLAPYSMPR